jgi:hypothetical protein
VLDFLNAVLPAGQLVCVAFRGEGKNGFIHKIVTDTHAAAKTAQWGLRKRMDAYFCISSMKELEWIDPQGKAHKRKKENCAGTKVFVLDVDIKAEGDKHYNTKEEALVALEAFKARLSLKQPLIVDSGYGLHVYWRLDRGYPSQKWEQLARYFKSVAVKVDAKLAADTSRIADCAGVLRVPGTLNFKNRLDPHQVKVLQWSDEVATIIEFGNCIKREGDRLGVETMAATVVKKMNGVDLGMDVPHRLEPVLKKCNWLKQSVIHKAELTEPEWYCQLGDIKHMYHDTRSMGELIHFFSKGHPGYTPEETERKFDQVRLSQSGPSLCERHRSLRPEWCEGCLYAPYVKTPVQLDSIDLPSVQPITIQEQYVNEDGEVVVASVETVPMPKPYFRGKDGGIYMHLDGGGLNGEEEDLNAIRKIYEYDIYPVARLQNEDTGEEEIEVHLHLPKDGKRVIRVPNQVVIEPKAFAGHLTARGVLLKPHEVAPLVSYMVDYTRVIQKADASQGVYTRFGWRNPQEQEASFILGDGMINNDGEFKACMTANWLKDQKEFASSKGELKKWRQAIEVLKTKSIKPYQFVLALGFASPLLALTPYHGLVFNLLGKGGTGKSTALKFMTSIWGKPTFTHIIKKDNSIPMFNKIGYLNSIPVAYDEITELPPEQTSDFVYSVSEGRGKERADRNGQTRVNFVKWSTIVVACSNLSLYEKIGQSKQGNAAPAYRIFETEVDGKEIDKDNQGAIEEALRVLSDNHGIAGRVFMQYVMKNRAAIILRLIAEEERLNRSLLLRNVERFWGGMFATVSVAMDICREMGLHSLDKEEMLLWARNELAKTRENLTESQGDSASVLFNFINSNLHATLFVNDDSKINAYGLSNTPTKELYIRLEKTKGKFYKGFISSMAFKRYCLLNNVISSWAIKDLRDQKIIGDSQTVRLGAGTEWSGGPVSCLSLNFNSPILDGLNVTLEEKKDEAK